MKRALGLSTAALAIALLAGCSGDPPDRQQPSNTAPPVAMNVVDEMRESPPAGRGGSMENASAINAERALRIIQDAGHSCSSVVAVVHAPDSTLATCSDRERYRLGRLTPDSQIFAMKCSAMREFGIEGAC